ncbi:hypothetical protein [Desulfovibrio cuneatus]|uniref:hypothetical protein n=1 Tax=Desulfovibrio cuneatus TaxID=159728 RepID=UPI00048924EC|nr:hypothetical protein [Desulfovibrio cuneatus]
MDSLGLCLMLGGAVKDLSLILALVEARYGVRFSVSDNVCFFGKVQKVYTPARAENVKSRCYSEQISVSLVLHWSSPLKGGRKEAIALPAAFVGAVFLNSAKLTNRP